MPNIVNHPGLKTILRLDAATCAAAAALQLAIPRPLESWLGLPAPLLVGSAVFLLAYVGVLLLMARAGQLRPWQLQLVVWGNVGWALGCAALAVGLPGVTGLGTMYLLAQAAAVLAIAAWQWRMGRAGLGPVAAMQRA